MKKKISRKTIAFIVCLVVMSAAMILLIFRYYNLFRDTAQTILPNDRPVNAEPDKDTQKLFSEVEGLISKKMNEAMIPGLSVAIVKDGETIYKSGFGYADLDSSKEVTSDTLFQLGSNSKAFTALGVFQLQKDVLIDLQDPISKYIPWLKLYYDGKEANVTIEEFLHHTSGISSNTLDKIPELTEENEDAIEKTVRTLVDLQLVNKPGEKYEYATINYDVLGLLIEMVSGMKYEDYIQKYVLDTAGLRNTYMYRSRIDANEMASGYKIGFSSPQYYKAPRYEGNKPAGYIISNANDMAEWLKIQMGTSTSSSLDNELVEKTHIPNLSVATFGKEMAYAAGWIVYNNDGIEILHSGSNPNYSSFIVFRPEERIGIAVLCNIKSSYTLNIAQSIMELFLQNQKSSDSVVDYNLKIDMVCVIIILISILIACLTIYPLIRSVCQLVRKKEKLHLHKTKTIIKISIISIIFLLLNCILYFLPYFLFNRVTWNYIFIWYPVTVKAALYLIYMCLWLLYLNVALKLARKND